ncbi:MAG: hypothetical protein WC805_00310 [Patescibacteria group bacterium]|jgi:hypothetical protein
MLTITVSGLPQGLSPIAVTTIEARLREYLPAEIKKYAEIKCESCLSGSGPQWIDIAADNLPETAHKPDMLVQDLALLVAVNIPKTKRGSVAGIRTNLSIGLIGNPPPKVYPADNFWDN